MELVIYVMGVIYFWLVVFPLVDFGDISYHVIITSE